MLITLRKILTCAILCSLIYAICVNCEKQNLIKGDFKLIVQNIEIKQGSGEVYVSGYLTDLDSVFESSEKEIIEESGIYILNITNSSERGKYIAFEIDDWNEFYVKINGLINQETYLFKPYLKIQNEIYYGSTTDFYYGNFWKIVTEAPIAVEHALSYIVDDKLLIGAGFGSNHSNQFWQYDLKNNSWIRLADMIDPGTSPTGFNIANKCYYLAHGNPNGTNPSMFYEYDFYSDTWIRKADFNAGYRSEAVGFSIGNKGYIVTGSSLEGPCSELWEYDPSIDSWNRKSDLPGPARIFACGFSVGNKGYVGTGRDASGRTLKDFWEYDPTNDSWTKMNFFDGAAREYATGFSSLSNGYIGFGSDGSSWQSSLNDLWEYDPTNDRWEKFIPMNAGEYTDHDIIESARAAAVGWYIQDRIFISLGYHVVNNIYYYPNDLWEYIR